MQTIFSHLAKKSNTNLCPYELDTVVVIPTDRTSGYRDWLDWMDENLVGRYHIKMHLNGPARVSFNEVRDAVLFKLYFG